MSKSVERVQNEHGAAMMNNHTATSWIAAAVAATAPTVARSYCMRRTLKSTYVCYRVLYLKKKTCALPILARIHVTYNHLLCVHFVFIFLSLIYFCSRLHTFDAFTVSLNVVGKIIEPILGFQLYIHVSHSTFTVLYNNVASVDCVWAQGWPKKMAGWLIEYFVKWVTQSHTQHTNTHTDTHSPSVISNTLRLAFRNSAF